MNHVLIFKILITIVFASVVNTNETSIDSMFPPVINAVEISTDYNFKSIIPPPSLMDNLRVFVTTTFKSTWQDLMESNDTEHNPNLALLRQFQEIHKNVTQAEEFIDLSENDFLASDWSYALVNGEIENIDTFYGSFVRFQNENLNESLKPSRAWIDLAETYLQTSNFGITKTLEKIHRYVVTKTKSENLFENVQKEMKSTLCNLHQSPHQIIYNLYNKISMAQLKGITMLQFSYMILNIYKLGNFINEAKLAQSNYEKYVQEEREVVKKVLLLADRSSYKCDPKHFVRDVTYTKVTKLLQGYIENEVNLNSHGTCKEDCSHYEYTKYYGCFKQKFCARQPQCQGKVLYCKAAKSDMRICTSSDPDRRYDWVSYDRGGSLGDKQYCPNNNNHRVESWHRWLFWHCTYCLCLCDDINRGGHRYFNLRDVTSDVEKHMVVTGVRLVRNNEIFHFQIQQGVILPQGLINKTTLSWKPIDRYSVYDENVMQGRDFHMLTWSEREIDTDDLVGPSGYVVTGVRFRTIGTHLNLEVRVTPMNFTTGELFHKNYSYWLGNHKTQASRVGPRTEINLQDPDVPTIRGPHLWYSRHNQYVRFQPTDFQYDVAQNTVPYIDSQPLTSGGFPISGLGILHRGASTSGGFLAPKIISYNFVPHLQ